MFAIMNYSWAFFCLLAVLSIPGYSQDSDESILLMTGKVIDGHVYDRDSMYIYYNEIRNSGKEKQGKLDLERVFSYTDKDGQEKIIYVVDSLAGNYFSIEEMRHYIAGEQDASDAYHANWVIYSAAPVAGAAGYVLSSSFLVFGVPFIYVVGTSVFPISLNEDKIKHKDLKSEPAYVLGYERTARSKRIFKALISSVTATALGFAIGQATK